MDFSGKAPVNYFCTWNLQNITARALYEKTQQDSEILKYIFDSGETFTDARAMLCEPFLFGKEGAVHQYPDLRGDLYLVIDDGWDLPFYANPYHASLFGSMIMDSKRFSSFRGNPAQRLKALNEEVKRHGWRGLGLWISSQMTGADYNKPYQRERFLQYFAERIEWCKYADIRYLKVGGGYHSKTVALRALLTELANEIFPELTVEHTVPHMPLNGDPQNGFYSYEDTSIYADAQEIASFSEVFRTHDVLGENLSSAITLDRIVDILPHCKGYLNCEDEMYLGAALGCTLGIRRCCMPDEQRAQEVYAAVKWQRYAPAFVGTELACSKDRLVDYHRFNTKDTWYQGVFDKQILQAAPAVVARNAPTPVLENQNHNAYIVCSQNPNGAYTIASIDCTSKTEQDENPSVRVKLQTPAHVGVLGWFARLTLIFDRPVACVQAYSLFDGSCYDLTDCCTDHVLCVKEAQLQAMHRATDRSSSAIRLAVLYK